jgi:hypothetical protein
VISTPGQIKPDTHLAGEGKWGEIVLGNTYYFAIFGKKFGKKLTDKRYK